MKTAESNYIIDSDKNNIKFFKRDVSRVLKGRQRISSTFGVTSIGDHQAARLRLRQGSHIFLLNCTNLCSILAYRISPAISATYRLEGLACPRSLNQTVDKKLNVVRLQGENC